MKISCYDNMVDIRDPDDVQITISEDESTLWVNVGELGGCVLRIQGITKISVEGKFTDQMPHDSQMG